MGFGDNCRAGLTLSFPVHVHAGLVFTLSAIPSPMSSLDDGLMAFVSTCKPRPFGTWSLCDVLILVTEMWEASLIPLVLGLFHIFTIIGEEGFSLAAFQQG